MTMEPGECPKNGKWRVVYEIYCDHCLQRHKTDQYLDGCYSVREAVELAGRYAPAKTMSVTVKWWDV